MQTQFFAVVYVWRAVQSTVFLFNTLDEAQTMKAALELDNDYQEEYDTLEIVTTNLPRGI